MPRQYTAFRTRVGKTIVSRASYETIERCNTACMTQKRLQSQGQRLAAMVALVMVVTARVVPETAPPWPKNRWKQGFQWDRRLLNARMLKEDESWSDCSRVTMKMMDNQVREQ